MTLEAMRKITKELDQEHKRLHKKALGVLDELIAQQNTDMKSIENGLDYLLSCHQSAIPVQKEYYRLLVYYASIGEQEAEHAQWYLHEYKKYA